jgi:hypothetical protein
MDRFVISAATAKSFNAEELGVGNPDWYTH